MVEFITPVCIVSGWYDGFAAFVLAGYCVITAILYHNFWSYNGRELAWRHSSEIDAYSSPGRDGMSATRGFRRQNVNGDRKGRKDRF